MMTLSAERCVACRQCAKLPAEGAGSIPFAIKCAIGARMGGGLLRMIRTGV